MTLAEWMEEKKLYERDVAELTGISRPVINRLKNGSRSPTFNHMCRILVVTKGKVRFKDWLKPNALENLKKELGA